ncbi:MAG: ABC transporter permease [Verrucomicrobium sp.]|nr:ABC transporter permease [Verrucomicrobium sp.]
MKPSLYIALRFTAARKRALTMSLSGVVLGVAFFISTQAQTEGFEQFFIDTVLGSSGAIVVSDRFQNRYSSMLDGEKAKAQDVDTDGDGVADRRGPAMVAVSGQQPRKYYSGLSNPNLLLRTVQEYNGVVAVAPVVEGNVTARTDFKDEVIKLDGIDLEAHLRATSLGGQIVQGSIERFRRKPYGIMMGALIADKLQVKIGDILYLTGAAGTRPFSLEAVFQTGINVIDETRGYVHKPAAQSIMKMPYAVSTAIVRLRDPDRAPELAVQLESQLSHRARSWQEREQGNLAVFRTLRLSAAITVSLIILLAGFGIFNILTMTVLNKVREIAILRSMGYRRSDIQNIFLFQGLIVASIGSLLGCVLGAILTFGMSRIPVKIRGIIHADYFVVAWSWRHYVMAAVIAFASVLIASYFPARRAASLPPVDTLRGSGQ